MKALRRITTRWSSQFAYAIGLLTTDGNLSIDGRHLDFTSQDREQLENFKKCLGLSCKISFKKSSAGTRVSRLQFGDVEFYKFLLSIGLTPKKSKTIGVIDVPNKYFFNFLRGHFDGDGTFYSYFDPRWRSSFMFYTVFVSASKRHIDWMQRKIFDFLGINGHITKSVSNSCYCLKYAKGDSLKLLPHLYTSKSVISLSRKRLKIERALAIIGQTLN